uniref:PH domain-containing protein n=1 Tax=Timema cristinae TaxID=61476 RepID=A0A7R9GU08_TIMCR|nr:unnamed protein product [Timema cristinae]
MLGLELLGLGIIFTSRPGYVRLGAFRFGDYFHITPRLQHIRSSSGWRPLKLVPKAATQFTRPLSRPLNLHNYGFITDLEGGRFFFNAVREGDSILFASDDENECHLWVMAMYRATGQSHKPTPPITPAGKNSTISKIQGGMKDIIL